MPRIAIATLLGLTGFLAYVAAAVTLADRLGAFGWEVQLLYFVIAGMLWVVPARWLILWSVRS